MRTSTATVEYNRRRKRPTGKGHVCWESIADIYIAEVPDPTPARRLLLNAGKSGRLKMRIFELRVVQTLGVASGI